MDKSTAEDITGLCGRHLPMASNEFLACQLGKNKQTTVQVSAFRSVHVPIFHLIAFGRDWEAAVSMWEKIEKKKQSEN
jgi:hypothetical protein